jgi:MFS family permease
LAFCYAALALGTVTAGLLSDRFQRRKQMIILSSSACIPILLFMGGVQSIWILAGMCGILFFLGGVIIALASVLAGLFAAEGERGRVFGILLLAAPVGAIIGGFSTGYLVDLWGYEAMYNILAAFFVLGPLTGLFIQDKNVGHVERTGASNNLSIYPTSYFFLLAASLASGAAMFNAVLVRSLEMDRLGFSAAAISGAAAVGSIASIPLQPLIGRLSDRSGRFPYLVLGYSAGVLGVVVMGFSRQVWGFWLASILLTLLISVSTSVGSALVADLVPAAVLGGGMSLFNSTVWVGGIVGYASSGYIVQNSGAAVSLTAAGLVMLISVLLLFPLRGK